MGRKGKSWAAEDGKGAAGPGVIRGRDWQRVRGRVSPASGEKTGDFTSESSYERYGRTFGKRVFKRTHFL
jgi:hypothetical protein